MDESLPRRLKRLLPGHDVITVPEQGWASKKNGELLQLAAGQFDVFITIDKNLVYQQNLTGINLAIIVLGAHSNRFDILEPLMPRVIKALERIEVGQVIRINA
ncbi:MAG: DUF5615 family PIN-like protein [Anaerolineae bacterium]